VGTEQVVPLSLSNIVLQVADVLKGLDCISCRLSYGVNTVDLEALVSAPEASVVELQAILSTHFSQLKLAVGSLGGALQSQVNVHQKVIQVFLTIPYQRELEQVSPLSEREQEILTLLTQGLRDRDVAAHLIISESTVKFHINNAVRKLKAQTRFQALYQVMAKGWIE
jgi:DNA-binding NarL/FixJ family response regulator